jgi:hypothetical protein
MKCIILLIGPVLFGLCSSTLASTSPMVSTSVFGTPIQEQTTHISPLDTLDRLRFIRLSLEHQSIQTFQEQATLLNPSKARPALVEEIEFRVSNDEFEPQDQRYDLRFRPTNPLIRKKTEELYQNRKLQLQVDASKALEEEVLERYELIINWIETQQALSLVEERISLNQQRITWLKQYPGADFFDAENFTEAHADVLKLWSEKTDLELKLKDLYGRIRSKMGDDAIGEFIIPWEQGNNVHTQDIQAQILNPTDESLSQPLQVYLAQLAVQETQIEQDIERVNFDVGFIQTEYFPNRMNKSLVGISAGISLPLFQRDRAELMDLSIEEKERSLELLNEQKQYTLEQYYWKSHVQLLLEKYIELQHLYAQMNLQEMQQTLQALDDYEPLKGLEWQEMQLDWKEIDQQWYIELVKSYIGYLSSTGLLSKEPMIDWLDAESY